MKSNAAVLLAKLLAAYRAMYIRSAEAAVGSSGPRQALMKMIMGGGKVSSKPSVSNVDDIIKWASGIK